MESIALISLAIVIRLALIAAAIWATIAWLRITQHTSVAQSESLARQPAPDATPFDQLPTADQRVAAIEEWAGRQAAKTDWVLDMQVARLFLLIAALAAVAVIPWGLPGWWGWLTAVPLVPMYLVYRLIQRAREEKTDALEAIEARRKQLVQLILEPRPQLVDL